jgi:hypothetical protein
MVLYDAIAVLCVLNDAIAVLCKLTAAKIRF